MRRIDHLERLDDTTLRLGGNGDNWHMTWADDGRQYVCLCDGTGWDGMPRAYYNSRLYAIAGDPPSPRFEFLPTYPDLVNNGQDEEFSRYYNFGVLALDGRLYQFLSTPNRPLLQPEPRFVGSKLIYSTDGGASWRNQDGSSPVRWEAWAERSRTNMVFFEEEGDAFSLLSVLQMGRNYSLNRDGFVYVYAPNGNTEGRMNQLVMFRVRREALLNRGAYEFFAGLGPDGGARWSPRIEDRAPTYEFPAGYVNRAIHPYAWQPSVVYYAPLETYLMANWGMGCGDDGMWFGRPSYLGFWSAPAPWGPWTQVHEETAWMPAGDRNARAYQPQIAPRWIAPDGRSFWLVWTDFQETKDAEGNVLRPYYAFNAQKVLVHSK
ncbi:MAG TPA: hypothetical protein PLD73_03530 [Candidatus Hydrogenedentes bacterium]|nr:hypothetical protein [Candidatus Hydrogenedentota bacterium]